MLPALHDRAITHGNAPFLPLAFRFAVAFGLVALHLALAGESGSPVVGETAYLLALAAFFLEALWEALRNLERNQDAFATPALPWVHVNLVLDILLVAIIIAFHGVDQERFATLYIFPVLASAFYLRIPEIVGVGALSVGVHLASVMLFTTGAVPAFGHSGPDLDPSSGNQTFLLAFASLQILAATLVVVLIRKHLETLRTTLRRSEAEVDALSSLYRRVFESMHSGLVTLDEEGRVISANPAAEAILQRPLPPGTTAGELGLVDLTQHGTHALEHRFERRIEPERGTPRIVGGNVAHLRDALGERSGHLILFQDLTELKALEERTRLNERLAAVGELSSELAHELRNPLASILGCVEVLRKREGNDPTATRALTILRRESERVSALVTDFLDFTRPRSMRMEPIWLPDLVEEARDAFETDPRSQGLGLSVESVPAAWTLGDRVCAHQVVANLLSNARKALRERAAPRLALGFRQEPGAVHLAVKDNGCGMDEDQARTAFLPFSSGFQEGTGLGLSLVYQFVQRMGWDIRLESEPGRGTTVHLRLPVVPAP